MGAKPSAQGRPRPCLGTAQVPASHSADPYGPLTARERAQHVERIALPGARPAEDGPRRILGLLEASDLSQVLPIRLTPHLLGGLKCPLCSKFVASDEVEVHLVMCLTKPRISYNEDVLSNDAGECAICLEDLIQGDTIARLPCLCVYHKPCIDSWFEVNRTCPEHPSD
uniref:E3 ubiquitin-protein ligase znrf2-like isoform X1 n=1 Tax=Myxine glutinosa TaxID=7769 RepID=UPI0035901210